MLDSPILLFLAAIIFGFLVTKGMLFAKQFKPTKGMRAKIRTPRGMVRTSFLAEMADSAWCFGAPIATNADAAPRVGDRLAIELTNGRARAFFQTLVLAIDPEPAYRLIVSRPEHVYHRDRRRFERQVLRGSMTATVDSAIVAICDISKQGARVASSQTLKVGDETHFGVKDQKVRAVVVGTASETDPAEYRLMFLDPVTLPG